MPRDKTGEPQSALRGAGAAGSSLEPPWRDKQRIKDELFGEDATAVEVMPPRGELVDAADMYHVWVLPVGFRLPFTIGPRP